MSVDNNTNKPPFDGFKPITFEPGELSEIPVGAPSELKPYAGSFTPLEDFKKVDAKPTEGNLEGGAELVEEGRRLVDSIAETMFDSEDRLRSAATHYLDTYTDYHGGESSATADVGVEPVLNNLNNHLAIHGEVGDEFARVVESVQSGVEQSMNLLRELRDSPAVDGRAMLAGTEIQELYKHMVATESVDEAKRLAGEISAIIEREGNFTDSSIENSTTAVSVVEETAANQSNSFEEWRREYGEIHEDRPVETLNAFSLDLRALQEVARSKGVEFGDRTRYLSGSVSEMKATWDRFELKYFSEK